MPSSPWRLTPDHSPHATFSSRTAGDRNRATICIAAAHEKQQLDLTRKRVGNRLHTTLLNLDASSRTRRADRTQHNPNTRRASRTVALSRRGAG
eukprot:2152172-Rhodomonas_salina.1